MRILLMLIFLSQSLFAQRKPNIIVILSDDAGYADFGFQSDRLVPTPNIDRIAREGVVFTNGYVTGAVCSPSRAGLLTGINQPKFGTVYNYIKGVQYNIEQKDFGIPADIKLVGDYLKPLGYTTGIVGKWHEGFAKQYQPNARGFDYFWGFLWGSSRYYAGKAVDVMENGAPVAPESIPYMTDAITNKSIAFIQKNTNQPYFLYVSYNAVHTPQEAKEEDIALFRDQFADKKRLMNAAMTHSLDKNIGRILHELEATQMLDHTIIIFANDNGGQKETLSADNFPLRGMKGDVYDGGIRVAMAMRWKEQISPVTRCNTIVSTLDFLPTIINAAGGDAKKIPALEGTDILDLLKSPDKYSERSLYWYTGKDKGALRKGDWKLVCLPGKTPELYNLKDDIAETKDLSASKKNIAASMIRQYSSWTKSLPPIRFIPLNGDSNR